MKNELVSWITAALQDLARTGTFPEAMTDKVQIERARDPEHGDFATNIAMMSAKAAQTNPRALAEQIIAALPEHPLVTDVSIAGPGFINIRVAATAEHSVIDTILTQGSNYGRNQSGNGQKVQVEFVSANPTGPLHVGHGRGAAYGATLANVLTANGYDVFREYYVNDAGRQMDILAVSVWLRYLAHQGVEVRFPDNGYRGDYVPLIAAELAAAHGEQFVRSAEQVMTDLPADEADGGDKEKHIDALISRAQALLGDDYRLVFDRGLDSVRADIEADLSEFGVDYDNWFSERSLTTGGEIKAALDLLDEKGYLENRDGTIWFLSTKFGDDKDRVVVRENGLTTYFASDIAYFKNRFDRGFDHVIEVWGADHHGYVKRVQAAMQALGFDISRLTFNLVQFAVLYRGGEKVQMSTRSGSFVTLRDLREQIGSDAARFYYVMRKADQHLDFDLDLAVSKSKDNPMYYIQYAHARLHTMLNKAPEKGMAYDEALAAQGREQLVLPAEKQLLKQLSQYPETIANAGERYEPHLIVYYLRDLATAFHSYYNDTKVLIDDDSLRNARLQLGLAVATVIHNGLTLLGVSAPKEM